MDYHYEYKGKTYINKDHLDNPDQYSIDFYTHVQQRKILGIKPYYDSLRFELVEDLPFFKCPVCGSNRFRTSQHEGKYTIHCSNRDYDIYHSGVNVCTGFEIDYKEWTDEQIKNSDWNKKHNREGQYNRD
jgi:hypothetical protein